MFKPVYLFLVFYLNFIFLSLSVFVLFFCFFLSPGLFSLYVWFLPVFLLFSISFPIKLRILSRLSACLKLFFCIHQFLRCWLPVKLQTFRPKTTQNDVRPWEVIMNLLMWQRLQGIARRACVVLTFPWRKCIFVYFDWRFSGWWYKREFPMLGGNQLFMGGYHPDSCWSSSKIKDKKGWMSSSCIFCFIRQTQFFSLPPPTPPPPSVLLDQTTNEGMQVSRSDIHWILWRHEPASNKKTDVRSCPVTKFLKTNLLVWAL